MGQSQNVVACIGGSRRCVGRGRYGGGRGLVVSAQVVSDCSFSGLGSPPGIKQRRVSKLLRSPTLFSFGPRDPAQYQAAAGSWRASIPSCSCCWQLSRVLMSVRAAGRSPMQRSTRAAGPGIAGAMIGSALGGSAAAFHLVPGHQRLGWFKLVKALCTISWSHRCCKRCYA